MIFVEQSKASLCSYQAFYTRVARWHIFKPKIPIYIGKIWRVLQWKMLVYFTAISSISLRLCSIFYGHLVYFRVIFSRFVMLYQEKSGNPVLHPPTHKRKAKTWNNLFSSTFFLIGPMPLFISFNTQTMHNMSTVHNSIAT
jgi:hypothetical protein